MRGLWLAVGVTMALPALAQDEAAMISVVANQIRSQGYACANPTSAKRDEAASVPLEPVYVLICENASYRVRIVPDQAADVTEIK